MKNDFMDDDCDIEGYAIEEKNEFGKLLDTLLSMGVSCKMNQITKRTFLANLKIMLPLFEKIETNKETSNDN